MDIRIRVGASLDASMDAVFSSITKSAQRTRKAVEREMQGMISAVSGLRSPFQATSRAMTEGLAGVSAEGRRAKAAVAGIGAGFASSLADAKRLGPALSYVTREAERASRSQNALARATSTARSAGAGGLFSPSAWNPRIRTSIPNPWSAAIGGGLRFAKDIARGAGIKTDASEYVASYVQRQSLATDIANSGYQPGAKGAAGQLQNSGDIQKEAMKVAMATATDPTKALEGLQKFVAVTGDLETGRKILGDMAKLSNATGSNLEDVVSAAGEVSAKLGDIPDKGTAINAIMRQISGQGKLGAVEMRDFAKQLAQVAAAAPRFQGTTQSNIGEMAILLQEARQLGGARSAAQAGTAVSAFTAQFSKANVVKKWSAMGIETRDHNGQLYSPEQLILTALQKTKGDSVKMGTLFNSSQARRATAGFEQVYHNAGGGKMGLEAVAQEFDRLRHATMSESDVEEANARKMATGTAQAQSFNNQLQAMADDMSAQLLPAMKELAPVALLLAGGLGAAVKELAPYIATAGQLAKLVLGGEETKTNYNMAGAQAEIAAANAAAGVAGPLDDPNRFVAEGGGPSEISKADFARFQTDRNQYAEQADKDREEMLNLAGKFSGNAREQAAKGDFSFFNPENFGTDMKNVGQAKDVLAARDKYESDKANADAMEQAMQRVMSGIFNGSVIKVEVTNQPNTPGGPPVADQSGRMPVAR